jgi:hypothetical protein
MLNPARMAPINLEMDDPSDPVPFPESFDYLDVNTWKPTPIEESHIWDRVRVITDPRMPVDRVGLVYQNHDGELQALTITGLRHDCDYPWCQLSLGHPGDHIVPLDVNDDSPKRLLVIISQDGNVLRCV